MLGSMRCSNYLVLTLILFPVVVFADRKEGVEAFRYRKYAEAEAALRPEAEKGDRIAQYFLAATLSEPLREIQGGRSPREADPRQQEAHAWLGRAAQQAYAKAMFEYALDFDEGYGTAPDFKVALEWMRKAVDAGDRYAMRQLERWYRDGHIVAPDLAMADALSELALADSPSRALLDQMMNEPVASSQKLMATRAKADPDRVARDLRDAEAGDAGAAYRVAVAALNAKDGNRDCGKVAYWLERAGDLGNVIAYSELGSKYYVGGCVKQDFARARVFLTKAIERSADIQAHAILAAIEFFGHGQPPDYGGAYVHLRVINMLDPNRFEGNRVMLNYSRRQLSAAQLAAAEQEIAALGKSQLKFQAKAKEQNAARRHVMSGGDSKNPDAWTYIIDLVDESGSCVRSAGNCEHVTFMTEIRIHNPEPVTLDCKLTMPVKELMWGSPPSITRRYIVMPRSDMTAPPETEIGSFDAAQTSLTCERVARPSVATGTCTVVAPSWAAPNQYFESAQRTPRRGDAVLVLTFARTPAHPEQVSIKTSSGAADFDAASLAFARDTPFETNCFNQPVPLAITIWR